MALPPKPPKFAIYPSVGIARVGDSPEYYVHPDEPTLDLSPEPFTLPRTAVTTNRGKFRDTANRIRRQAARFRIYEVNWKAYNNKTWIPADPVKQIKAGSSIELRWKVNVCNAKHFPAFSPPASDTPPALATRTRLEATADITSKPPLTHKVLKVPKAAAAGRPNDIVLGAVTVDADGNLLFVGGEGQCFSDGATLLPGPLFQPKWFDDVCDGRIECEVFEGGVSKGSALPAWVVTGKPAFSQAMPQFESLYDVAKQLASNRAILPITVDTKFVRDVFPVIRAIERLRWTSNLAQLHRTAPPLVNKSAELAKLADKSDPVGRAQRRALFDRLTSPRMTLHSYREPSTGVIDEDFDRALARMVAARPASPKNMPMMWDTTLVGDRYYHMYNLANDNYTDDYDRVQGIPAQTPFSAQTPLEQLDTLNRAYMETALGGSNMPGLEVGFRASERNTWAPIAFRIDAAIQPGYLTASLSVPWPKDYSACADGDRPLEWWPPGRPIRVFNVNGDVKEWERKWAGEPGNTVATAWKGLGFLKFHPASKQYREDERTLPEPPTPTPPP